MLADEHDTLMSNHWKNDALDGRSYGNYRNGKLAFEKFYAGGFKTGRWTFYLEDGNVNYTETFEEGKTRWDRNDDYSTVKYYLEGKPAYTATFVAGRKDKVKDLERELRRSGFSIKAFHSDLEQSEREAIMQAFRNKEIQMLIGTDILSRGIDVDGISLVINYDVPPDPEDYVHRIGRTARAETTGAAITFVNPKDERRFGAVEKLIGKQVTKQTLPMQFADIPPHHSEQKKSETAHHKKSSFRGRPKRSGSGSGGGKPQ